MNDFVRDWRRWSPAERWIAGLIIALMLIGVPTVVAVTARLS